METFVASRMSEGNKTFPIKILIDIDSITVKHPGMFSGKEQTIPYKTIARVDVESPAIGYSTIIIYTSGHGAISAHGFKKSEVMDMKKIILAKIS